MGGCAGAGKGAASRSCQAGQRPNATGARVGEKAFKLRHAYEEEKEGANNGTLSQKPWEGN